MPIPQFFYCGVGVPPAVSILWQLSLDSNVPKKLSSVLSLPKPLKYDISEGLA